MGGLDFHFVSAGEISSRVEFTEVSSSPSIGSNKFEDVLKWMSAHLAAILEKYDAKEAIHS